MPGTHPKYSALRGREKGSRLYKNKTQKPWEEVWSRHRARQSALFIGRIRGRPSSKELGQLGRNPNGSSTIPDRMPVYASISRWRFPISPSVLTTAYIPEKSLKLRSHA